MSEFITWEILGTYAGSLAMVMILTQFVKDVSFLKKVPTQFLSYILALAVLYPAMFFTGQLTANIAVITLFNAIILSMAANGGFSAVMKATGKATDGALLIDTSNPTKDVYRLDVGSIDGLADKKSITLKVKDGKIYSN